MTCPAGTFTKESLDIIVEILELQEVSAAVKEEDQWIKRSIELPNSDCCSTKDELGIYLDLIMNTADGHNVFEYDKTVLASDMGSLVKTGWLQHSILTSITKLVNKEVTSTKLLMLNELLTWGSQSATEHIKNVCRGKTKSVTFIVCVGKRKKSNEVFIGSPSKPGCHWTVLYVDLTINQWYYFDSFGWKAPRDLTSEMGPLVQIMFNALDLPYKPFRNYVYGHEPSTSPTHSCTSSCLPNAPLQTLGNICGVVTVLLASISSLAPSKWKNWFLDKRKALPEHQKWLLSPIENSDYLRSVIISWFMKGNVDLSVIGITDCTAKENDTQANRHRELKNTFIPRSDYATVGGSNKDDIEKDQNVFHSSYSSDVNCMKVNSCKESDNISTSKSADILDVVETEIRKNIPECNVNVKEVFGEVSEDVAEYNYIEEVDMEAPDDVFTKEVKSEITGDASENNTSNEELNKEIIADGKNMLTWPNVKQTNLPNWTID